MQQHHTRVAASLPFAKALAGRQDVVRVTNPRTGRYDHWETWPDSEPAYVYAVGLADRDGSFPTLGFDLDAKRLGPEAAARAAELVVELTTSVGMSPVGEQSGPGDGRHVWVTLAEPASPDLVTEVARRLKLAAPALDTAPLTNPRTGCLRPPGSLHPAHLESGWRSRILPELLDGDDPLERLARRAPLSALLRMADLLPPTKATRPAVPPPTEKTGKLDDEMLELLACGTVRGRAFPTRSEALQSFAWRARWAGSDREEAFELALWSGGPIGQRLRERGDGRSDFAHSWEVALRLPGPQYAVAQVERIRARADSDVRQGLMRLPGRAALDVLLSRAELLGRLDFPYPWHRIARRLHLTTEPARRHVMSLVGRYVEVVEVGDPQRGTATVWQLLAPSTDERPAHIFPATPGQPANGTKGSQHPTTVETPGCFVSSGSPLGTDALVPDVSVTPTWDRDPPHPPSSSSVSASGRSSSVEAPSPSSAPLARDPISVPSQSCLSSPPPGQCLGRGFRNNDALEDEGHEVQDRSRFDPAHPVWGHGRLHSNGWWILDALSGHGAMRQGEIARATDLDRSAVSRWMP